MKRAITFIIPVGDDDIYHRCFQSSPVLATKGPHEVLCQRGYKSAAAAFNAAIEDSSNDLMVFCHQDIVFPRRWNDIFWSRLQELADVDERWGVVGCAGRTQANERAAHLYRHDREFVGDVSLPARVRTLDECIISFRRSSRLRFDENMIGFFFYAVDICMQAESRGLKNYVVDAPCFHQGKDRSILPAAFYEAERYMIGKWKKRLPIQTLSGRVGGRAYLGYKRLRNRWDEFLASKGRRPAPWWTDLPKISPEHLLR
jgi:Glycosyltransferase like family